MGNEVAAHATRRPVRHTGLFCILELPAELVLQILHFAVVTSSNQDPIKIEAGHKASLLPPAITQTCRLLRNEGLRLFYSLNVFWGLSSDSGARLLWRWLQRIGLHNCARIRALFVRYTTINGASIDIAGEARDWSDFLCEMIFQGHRMLEHSAILNRFYVRQEASKVVIYRDGSYQLSLEPQTSEGDQWLSMGPLLQLQDRVDDLTEWGPYCIGEIDWWVPAKES